MLQPRVVMNRGYPSLFAPDSEDELSSDSGSDAEGQTRPSLLPLNVSMHTHTLLFPGEEWKGGREGGGGGERRRKRFHLSVSSLLSGCWDV